MPRTGLTSAEIRERAIDVAQAQLRKHGFEKLRFSEVAKGIGVSHAALYAHFKDKSDLLDALTERWLMQMDAALDAVCEGPGNAVKRIEKWYATVHEYKVAKVMNDPALFSAFEWTEAQKKRASQVHMANLHRQITGLLKEAYAAKLLTKYSVDKARTILREGMVGFYHPRILVLHLGERREGNLKATLETLLRGLR